MSEEKFFQKFNINKWIDDISFRMELLDQKLTSKKKSKTEIIKKFSHNLILLILMII